MCSQEPIYYETHSHTPLCRHAVGDPIEYAERAWLAGLKGLTVTCHNPMPDGFARHVRMDQADFPEYLELIAAARDQWMGRVDVLLGLECDYFPGFEGFLEQQTQSQPFDYILGSVHPQLKEFRDRFGGGNACEYQRNYFEQLAVAAETGFFDCLAHPDLVKNVTADYWNPERIMGSICEALDRIAVTGVAMELNTSGMNKTIREMNPFPAMLAEMRSREIPVVIGADAHQPHRVGDRFATAMTLLEAAGYSHVSYFVGRERQDAPIAAARNSIGQLASQRGASLSVAAATDA